MYSIKSDGPLTRELEEKHQHQDDEKGMKDRLLENIPEPEPVVGDLGLGHLGVQRHEGVEVILMEREQFLQICCIFKTDSENAPRNYGFKQFHALHVAVNYLLLSILFNRYKYPLPELDSLIILWE